MLETVDLSLKLSKEDYKQWLPRLKEDLRILQQQAREAGLPVIILFEGWDASGKGDSISQLLDRLDPHGFRVHPISAPIQEELYRPFLWRFWTKIPGRGQIAIFDRSWYGRVHVERVDKICTPDEWHQAYQEINEFERQLVDDGTVIVKKDVKSSFSIKAQGNIEVMGSVEDAVLISEKSIIIKNGFVGKGTGNVTAKEDVIIHHISSQTVHAGRDIIIGEESMNANLRAENSLKVLGKKGTIIGGSAYALHLIETKIAGTGACIPTILSAGITRENFARIRELEGLIEKNQENLKRIKQNVYTLFREKLDKNQLPPDKENLLEQMKKAQASLPLQIDALQHELEQLNAIREKLKFSNVQVTDTAFPKVRIVMGEDIMELREAYRSAVFMLEKGTISLFIKGKRVKLG